MSAFRRLLRPYSALSRKNRAGLALVSLVFGLLNAAGNAMYAADHLPSAPADLLRFALLALGSSVLFYFFAALLLYVLSGRLLSPRAGKTCGPAKKGRGIFWAAFSVILLGWLPWIVAYYPCSADYDVYSPISQYLNLIPRSNSFPWFYSTVVGFFYSVGKTLGDKNIGLFLHIAVRAPLMAAVYAHLVSKLSLRGVRTGVLWAVTLFYAFVPVWGAYAKHAFKDTLSAALFCWYIVCTVDAADALRSGDGGLKPFALQAAASLMICLFRNNCILICAPVTLLLLVPLFRRPAFRGRRMRICAVCLSGLLLFGGYQLYIRKAENVAPGSPRSALTVLFQQTARTVRDEEERISEEDRAVLSAAFDYPRLGAAYDPVLSDPVKALYTGGEETFRAYLRAWARMAVRHPRPYLEAALSQGYGYYAFTPDQPEHAGNWNCGMTIFNWVKDSRFDSSLTGDYTDASGPVRQLLEDWADLWHRLPLLGFLDDMPLYTWFIVCAGLLMMWRKQQLSLIPVLACLLNVLLCCCSPVNDCFRYFAPVAAAAPACLLLPFSLSSPGESTALARS